MKTAGVSPYLKALSGVLLLLGGAIFWASSSNAGKTTGDLRTPVSVQTVVDKKPADGLDIKVLMHRYDLGLPSAAPQKRS